jgi:RNA-directed DNA polymerase
VSLSPPAKVRKLQAALHAKAKGSPDYRFYALYDKVYREDVLDHAYECSKANRGAAGADGRTFGDIEAYGRKRWLGELAEELKGKTYRPQAVRRVWIPKPNGKQRPLGIPTIRDRVVQVAAVLVLEPIFEADLLPEQNAYRPRRGARDAVRAVHRLLTMGHREVVDADLSGYFDSIPHAELMKSVARRISDGQVLHLIKMWLEAPVEETDEGGRRSRTTRNRDEGRGVPQGAPISPLLSNLYMRRFILGWKALGHERLLDAHIVNYADDFVICCRGTAQEAARAMRSMMSRLKLTVNEDKTHVCSLPEESFEFLGYTIGRCWSPKTGRSYIGTRPSKKRIQGVCARVSEMTSHRWYLLEAEDRVRKLNRLLRGWANYFCLGPVSKAYRAVDAHVRRRLRQWLCGKHQRAGGGIARYPDEYLYQTLGLVRLQERTRSFPWAQA